MIVSHSVLMTQALLPWLPADLGSYAGAFEAKNRQGGGTAEAAEIQTWGVCEGSTGRAQAPRALPALAL